MHPQLNCTLPRVLAVVSAGIALVLNAAATHAQTLDPVPRMAVDNGVIVERQALPSTWYKFLPGLPGRGPAPLLQFSRDGLTLLEVGPFGELNLGPGGIRFAPENFIPAAQVQSVGHVVGYIGARVGSSAADWRFVLIPVFEPNADPDESETTR